MKSSLFLFIVAFLLIFSPTALGAWQPKIVNSGFFAGYIPEGFDSNDQVQIVAEGIFPNSCFRPKDVLVEVDSVKKEIRLQARAFEYEGMCLQVLIPYHQVIDLGLLEAGAYQILQKGFGDPLGVLDVRFAKNASADDYLYAPISQAFFQNKEGSNQIILTGEFTNSCMKLVDVVTQFQPRVITVQPISEMEERSDCVKGKFPFQKTVDLPNPIASGRYLLHVRSINAKALNTLIDIP